MAVAWIKSQGSLDIDTCCIDTPYGKQQRRPIGKKTCLLNIFRDFRNAGKGHRQIALPVELDGLAHHRLPNSCALKIGRPIVQDWWIIQGPLHSISRTHHSAQYRGLFRLRDRRLTARQGKTSHLVASPYPPGKDRQE